MESKYQLRQQSKFADKHKDLIHDIAFDFYGRRLATCSYQNVKACILFVFAKMKTYFLFIERFGMSATMDNGICVLRGKPTMDLCGK